MLGEVREKTDHTREKDPEVPSLKRFTEHLASTKKSPRTVKDYTRAAATFLRWVGKAPADVLADDLEKYRVHLALEKKYRKNSLYITIKALQAFFRFLHSTAADKLQAPKRAEKLPEYLTEDETRRLLKAAAKDPRDYAILRVLATTGLRVSELCALDVEAIDFSDGTIRVRAGKGEKDRIVVLEEKTASALAVYMKVRVASPGDPGALFVSRRALLGGNGRQFVPRGRFTVRGIEKLIAAYATIAEIPGRVTPHVLRHTLATTLLRHGADIRFIQALLGHSSISTTQIYTHVDDASLKKAYRDAKPDY